MQPNKFILLAAVAASAIGATAAQAQSVFNHAELDGVGENAIVQRQAYDCYGANQPLGFSGTVSPSVPGTVPTNIEEFYYPATGNGIGSGAQFYCATRVVQPNIVTRYLGTGSDIAVRAFLNHVSPDGFGNVAVPPGFARYAYGIQFIGSDNPLSSADITAYNSNLLPATTARDGATAILAGTAPSRYGAPIQLPLFIVPIALAYSAVYATEIDPADQLIRYRFRLPAGAARPDGSGGMKLTRAHYCGIMTGTLTNWNQLPTSVVNKDANDIILNWATTGVPIRLVGRSDGAGTTALLSRALAAQCNGVTVNTGVNGVGSPVVISTAGNFTGTASRLPASLVGPSFNKATYPATGTQVGLDAPGKYRVASGSDGVAQAIAFHPDPYGPAHTRTTNGQIGYVGSDAALPAVLYTGQNPYSLNTASLQVNGAGNVYVGPTAKDAAAAFAGFQPPQSTGAFGAYCSSAATFVCASTYGDRANPLDWLPVTYKKLSLAAPTTGYPIVGTSQIDLYTCYDSPAARKAVVGQFATFVGKTLFDATGSTATSKIPPKLITDPVKGLLAKNGIAAIPTAWQYAISETFFKSSLQVGTRGDATTKLGLRNLWIQDRIPTTATSPGSLTNGNPTCAGKVGA